MNSVKQSSFVTMGEAAEMLLGAELTVSTKVTELPGWANGTRAIYADGEVVAAGYRDGATWKYKRDVIQEFIDTVELNRAREKAKDAC